MNTISYIWNWKELEKNRYYIYDGRIYKSKENVKQNINRKIEWIKALYNVIKISSRIEYHWNFSKI